MKKLHLILISLILALCLLSTVALTYAYFVNNIESSTQPEFSLSDDGSTVITVLNSTDLFMYSKDSAYNSTEIISSTSNSTARVTLKLGATIQLGEDLLITADCHLDLGGYTLMLNGHSITFMHSYYGSVVLSNGTIQTSSVNDKVYFKTPNATVICDSVVFTDGTNTLTNSDYIQIIGVNAKYVSYNALYMISRTFMIETDYSDERLDYSEIESNVSLVDGLYDFSSINFVTTHNYCGFHNSGTSPYSCFYVLGDIDLPVNYYAYENVSISYESSLPAVVSTLGKVTPVANTVTDVVLTAVISADGAPIASYDFNLHVIDDSHAASLANLGKSMLGEMMHKYYSSEQTSYLIHNAISLPKEFSTYGAGINYSYTVMSNDATPVDITSSALTLDYDGDGDDDSFYSLSALETLGQLNATITVGATTVTESYSLTFITSDELQNEHTAAQSIVSDWYGSMITVSDTLSGGYNGYTTTELYDETDANTTYDITDVSYVLMNNSDDVYAMGDVGGIYSLYVQADKHPEAIAQDVLLNITFTFLTETGSLEVEIQVPIEFQPSSQGSTNFHAFLAYYTYFDRLLTSTMGGATTVDFTMPFCYGNSAPVVCYDLTGVPTDSLALSLFYNGTDHVLTLSAEQTSYTQALDAHLTANSLTLSDVIAYGDSAWHFIIDTDYIPTSNSIISLIYNYKRSLDGAWEIYDDDDSAPIVSTFTLQGILRCLKSDGTTDSTGMPDEVLYKWVYDNFNNYESGSLSSYTLSASSDDYLTKFVLVDWLAQDVTFEKVGTAIGTISSYKGIEFLRGTKIVTITSTSGITTDAMQYLAQMSSLEELDISDNALTDSTVDFLAALSASTSIRVLDLSNNDIYDFSDLLNFVSLETVYVYGNVDSGIDCIFYGASGLTNISTFNTLISRGVVVYNGISGTAPISYESSSTSNDYNDLQGVEYQRRIGSNQSIETVYEDFSTDPDFYGLSSSYTNIEGDTATVSTGSLVWGYEGTATTATSFTLTYTCTITLGTDTETISIVVEFPVTRG